jgi:serine/threonine protein kinase
MNKKSYFNDNYTTDGIKLGSGTFGDVFEVKCLKTNIKYAAKFEKNNEDKCILPTEAIILEDLTNKNIQGIPKKIDYVVSTEYNILIMDLLDKSLHSIFKECNKKFKLNTVLLLGIDILNIIEQLHNANYVHRDIKPSNFMIGFDNNLYLVDFGLAKKYMKGTKHVKYTNDKSLVGTSQYVSLNIHYGFEYSRRDDLESIGYLLVYFLKGLPWQNKSDDDIKIIKLSTRIEKLCEDLPKCFEEFIKYCRKLSYKEKPDYDYLRNLFTKEAKGKKLKYEFI